MYWKGVFPITSQGANRAQEKKFPHSVQTMILSKRQNKMAAQVHRGIIYVVYVVFKRLFFSPNISIKCINPLNTRLRRCEVAAFAYKYIVAASIQ